MTLAVLVNERQLMGKLISFGNIFQCRHSVEKFSRKRNAIFLALCYLLQTNGPLDWTFFSDESSRYRKHCLLEKLKYYFPVCEIVNQLLRLQFGKLVLLNDN